MASRNGSNIGIRKSWRSNRRINDAISGNGSVAAYHLKAGINGVSASSVACGVNKINILIVVAKISERRQTGGSGINGVINIIINGVMTISVMAYGNSVAASWRISIINGVMYVIMANNAMAWHSGVA